jgi:hypothetical protein
MQRQQRIARARRDRVSAALIVAELDERRCVVQFLDDRAHLAADEPALRSRRSATEASRAPPFKSLSSFNPRRSGGSAR